MAIRLKEETFLCRNFITFVDYEEDEADGDIPIPQVGSYFLKKTVTYEGFGVQIRREV